MQKRHLTCSVVEKNPICWNPPHKAYGMQGCKARQSVKITSHSPYYIMKWVSEACRQIRDIVWWFGKCMRHFSSPTHTHATKHRALHHSKRWLMMISFFFFPLLSVLNTLRSLLVIFQGFIINNWPSRQQYRWDMIDSSSIIFTKFSVKKKFCAVLHTVVVLFLCHCETALVSFFLLIHLKPSAEK